MQVYCIPIIQHNHVANYYVTCRIKVCSDLFSSAVATSTLSAEKKRADHPVLCDDDCEAEEEKASVMQNIHS